MVHIQSVLSTISPASENTYVLRCHGRQAKLFDTTGWLVLILRREVLSST
jgi:hypothetical protein